MDKVKQSLLKEQYVPQFQVRSNLCAGESLEACVNSLNDWQKHYQARCKKEGVDVKITPYTV
jgi:hypothetical protein